jgi:predicted DNA-binding transcriptional regulator AlpA
MPIAPVKAYEDLPLLLEPKDVMAVLGLSKKMTMDLLNKGTPPFPILRLGDRTLRVPRASFIRWLEGQNLQEGPDDAA